MPSCERIKSETLIAEHKHVVTIPCLEEFIKNEMKVCKKCGQMKVLVDFTPQKKNKDGRCGTCKKCRWEKEHTEEFIQKRREWARQDYHKNEEKHRAARRQYYHNNQDKCNRSSSEYYYTHQEEVKAYRQTPEYKEKSKQWKKNDYQKNKDQILKKQREYYLQNKEKIDDYRREYRKGHRARNRERYRQQQREYRAANKERQAAQRKERWKNDENYRMKSRLRWQLRQSLKDVNASKTMSALKLLGCTIDEFKTYLESKFQPGMTWDNYSKWGWHIDHIIPISAFDLTDPEQQKKCFFYQNMQPLWWEENTIKGDRLPDGIRARHLKKDKQS